MLNLVRDFTEITLKNENGTYTINVPQVEMHIGDMIQEIIVPVLRAAGYGDSSIEQRIYME